MSNQFLLKYINVFLRELIVAQLGNKLPAFNKTQKFHQNVHRSPQMELNHSQFI